MGGLGSLALSRHRFRDALALGEQATALNPYSAQPWGVIGDAQVELGRYRAGVRLVRPDEQALRPNLSSYARVSYGRELIGHTARGDPGDEARRRRRHRRGGADRLDARPARQAVLQPRPVSRRRARVPARPPGLPRLRVRARRARPGARRARVATGRRSPPSGRRSTRSRCRSTWPRSATSTASPGRPVLARRQYDLIGAIEKLLNANGVKTDLEIALFQVDHGIALRHALARARLGHARAAVDRRRRRPRLGARPQRPLRRGAALLEGGAPAGHAGRAQVLPPRDDRALPRPLPSARAWFRRALDLNPHFSLLWAPVARRLAA